MKKVISYFLIEINSISINLPTQGFIHSQSNLTLIAEARNFLNQDVIGNKLFNILVIAAILIYDVVS